MLCLIIYLNKQAKNYKGQPGHHLNIPYSNEPHILYTKCQCHEPFDSGKFPQFMGITATLVMTKIVDGAGLLS